MTTEYPDRTKTTDENLWLEDIHGEKQLEWIQAQNERTLAMFDADALATTKAHILEVYDSDDRIPMVTKRGNWYYNFWQDAEHPRGLWRRTTIESYKTDTPDWEIILDIDALGEAEDTEWVFNGASLCHPDYSRALLRLSPDGGDGVVTREFDVETRTFVDGGFHVPYAKSDTTWIDVDTIFVGTDFGSDSLTTSGYPRQVRRLKRGASLADAEIIHTVPQDYTRVSSAHDHAPGYERDLVIEMIDFFNFAYLLLVDDELVRLDVPTDSRIGLHREWLTVQPKSEWNIGGNRYPVGSLLAINFDAFLGGSRDFQVVFEPDKRTSLQFASWTRDHLILNLIQDVTSHVIIATPGESDWTFRELETPELQSTSVYAVDEDESNDYWMTSSGYLQPTTLSTGTLDDVSAPEHIKSTPAMFNTDGVSVEQHFATSKDGTRVPYFQIGRSDLTLDGSNPTVLYGYGGFEISLIPAYDAATGRAFVEHGGVYVVANIRGGGEYGPTWHTDAQRQNRHRAYEDFAAVAQDLIDRGVTNPRHLGCMGGSNGGLLVGNMLTHYPELFGAVVCTVPLLDMQRYIHLNAGASWIAEYGDPEKPEDWAFIQTFSPYHNLREGVDYPPILFYTATSDDRVGPVQARKMAARMQAQGIGNVRFYENTQGGHAGSADNNERAMMRAMSFEFLRKHLG